MLDSFLGFLSKFEMDLFFDLLLLFELLFFIFPRDSVKKLGELGCFVSFFLDLLLVSPFED